MNITRPIALVCAVATLFAALLLCTGPAGGHHQDTAVGAGDPGRTLWNDDLGPVAEARYTCPYDEGDCGLFPHPSPAVLTVPASPGALAATDPCPFRPLPCPGGGASGYGPLARAPDLHVLQVLRT